MGKDKTLQKKSNEAHTRYYDARFQACALSAVANERKLSGEELRSYRILSKKARFLKNLGDYYSGYRKGGRIQKKYKEEDNGAS